MALGWHTYAKHEREIRTKTGCWHTKSICFDLSYTFVICCAYARRHVLEEAGNISYKMA